ncbi:hypothetical protein AXG93_411s1020 [Marchantia polymorpha subsp. ruderalis]|uniref:SGNH hydrolase-type esterase domain-containing protein n=1 Tax=Marchantia polymorpha subsp. ruderalis TaxID=1480154 RepID=A0A176VIT0_MARPO|nr:hypothetical protein AXG93_411s1020 [Marchantia polymorpha subsp. ruderalis]
MIRHTVCRAYPVGDYESKDPELACLHYLDFRQVITVLVSLERGERLAERLDAVSSSNFRWRSPSGDEEAEAAGVEADACSAWSACPSQKDDDPRTFFVFGDSYADTGNAPFIASSWRSPYGLSWPGRPTGRFSDGIVKTDVLASEALCLPSPPPYAQILNASLSGGINFAVAGSGTMQAFGTPPFGDQVDWFSGYVDSKLFSPYLLKNAVVFVSVSGNDYAVYNGTTLQGYLPLVTQVVDLIERNLRQLYTLGVRNFMVSTLAPLRCLPARTASTGLTEGLRPCCTGACGETDETGKHLYEVCDDPNKYLFWDYFHPTQAGWKAVVNLYSRKTRPGFTRISPSLAAWADNL